MNENTLPEATAIPQELIERKAREYMRERLRAWRRENGGRVNETARKWYAANRDRLCAKRRERFATDAEYAEKIRAYAREYSATHREKMRENYRAWYAAHRESFHAKRRERLASDPEYAERQLAHKRAYFKRRMQDPVYAEKHRAYMREYHKRRKLACAEGGCAKAAGTPAWYAGGEKGGASDCEG